LDRWHQVSSPVTNARELPTGLHLAQCSDALFLIEANVYQ